MLDLLLALLLAQTIIAVALVYHLGLFLLVIKALEWLKAHNL